MPRTVLVEETRLLQMIGAGSELALPTGTSSTMAELPNVTCCGLTLSQQGFNLNQDVLDQVEMVKQDSAPTSDRVIFNSKIKKIILIIFQKLLI